MTFPTQTIIGVIPAKSNSYRIITLLGKSEPVECPDCDGEDNIVGPKCKTCGGFGVVDIPGNKHASLAKSHKLKKYENDFQLQCRHYRNKNIEGYFQIEVDVFYPTRRADLDNAMKVLMDCLQKVGAYKNDNKCNQIIARRYLDPKTPRIEFFLTQVNRPETK
jgi:Holliday junction resolvase RusA-like endonuclease